MTKIDSACRANDDVPLWDCPTSSDQEIASVTEEILRNIIGKVMRFRQRVSAFDTTAARRVMLHRHNGKETGYKARYRTVDTTSRSG